ncbi:MAG: hypothetical protein HYV07_05385 [Deltaproteobacteria bacterium]|nr:hypothetical protein [Deltaproteobacteria bacterium]
MARVHRDLHGATHMAARALLTALCALGLACGTPEPSLCEVRSGTCGYNSDPDCGDLPPEEGTACGQVLVCYYCSDLAEGYDCIGGTWRRTRTFNVCS